LVKMPRNREREGNTWSSTCHVEARRAFDEREGR
jgi:hypothetical protein